jgi:phospholipid/cholesterol/gamma-HCH transport system substrate-binding protein
MERDRRLSITVGGLVLVALAMLVVTILSLSSQRGAWTPRYRLVSYFDNVGGLIQGAPVWLAGTPVGGVQSVAFGARASGGPAVEVVLQIDRDVQERIRSDSVAAISTIGVLGDRYVEISMGTDAGRILQEGEELPAVSPLDINLVMVKGAEALDRIVSLAERLDAVVEQFDEEQGGQSLAAALSTLSDIIVQIQEGEGLLHSLIYDQYEGSGVESIETSLATLENILREVDQGDGVLHSLIYDAPAEQDVVLQVLEAGSHLNSVLAKIDRGEGTLGLLLNDPTLYEELKLLVGGAQRSLVVRSLIRMATDEP